MELIARSRWGARPPAWNSGSANPSRGVFIHYNGPPVSNAVLSGDFEAVAAFLRSTQNYHMNSNSWPDIAYSFCVDSMGRCWELRGWGVAGAHTLGWNWSSHAIFLPLGGDQAPTEAQIATCRQVIAEHNRRYGVGFVKGHQDAPNQTSCPGPAVLPLVRAGRFTPSSGDVFVPPSPPGVDVAVSKPTLMREPKGTVWLYYENSPFRMHVKSMDDVQVFRFFGVPYKDLDQKQADFFRRNSQEIKGK